MTQRTKDLRLLGIEVFIALGFGGVVAVVVEPATFGVIDEMLLTFVSIVVAAAVPGVALTASASRPRQISKSKAAELGELLKDQIAFWLGFLLWGSLAALALIVGHATGWQLLTPRPAFLPDWVPTEGGRWFVFAAVALCAFTAIRLRRIARAIGDLVRLGTDAHLEVAESPAVDLPSPTDAVASMEATANRGSVVRASPKSKKVA